MTIQTRLVTALAHLPRPTASVGVLRAVEMPTRDGVTLRADVWLPRPLTSSAPLVLVRTPYDRRGMDLAARLLTERGHPVVVQSCRGCFGSGGDFDPFRDEQNDSEDTIEWLSLEPWADRPISLLGASYFGHTAYTTVAAASDRVASMVIAVSATDMRAGALYPDDVFASETTLTWIAGLTTQEIPTLKRLRVMRRLKKRMAAALAVPESNADRVLLGEQFLPYQDWVRHDRADDPWWEPLDRTGVRATMLPSVLIAGWYDPFVVQQLADYEAMTGGGRRPRLIVGPWTHGSPAIATHLVRESLRIQEAGHVGGATVWDEGLHRWVELSAWPPATVPRRLVLDADRSLTLEPRSDLDLVWDADPSDPPPAAGGRGLNPLFAGRRRQTEREKRADVQVFSTHVLRAPLTIAGRASVELVTDATAVPQDWFVRLCDVDRRGVSRNIADGFVRVPPSSDALTVKLSPAAFSFRAGHRIRLQITGTGYPFHPLAAHVAPRRLLSKADARSVLELPTLEHGWGGSGTSAGIVA